MKKLILSFAILTAVFLTGHAGAQGQKKYEGKAMPANMPGHYSVIQGGELAQVMQQIRGDTPVRVYDSPNGHLGAYVLTYLPLAAQPGQPVHGTYHEEVASIYYVVRGTGSMALGGELEDARENDPESRGSKTVTGPTVSGIMKNFEVVHYEPGTMIFVPPGVPHLGGYDITTKTDFLVFRIDPKKALDLKEK